MARIVELGNRLCRCNHKLKFHVVSTPSQNIQECIYCSGCDNEYRFHEVITING